MKKYEIVHNAILNQINSGKLTIGESIPSENELASQFNTSRATVRHALAELDKNGFILKQQGKETIVVSNTDKPKTVLLILPNLFKYIFKELIQGIEVTLRKENIYLLIARSYNDQKIERDIIRNYIGTVDGIILEPTQAQYTKYIHSKTYASLQNIPAICINSKLENFNIPSLIVDDFNSMKKLSEQVLILGKKRILVLAKTDDLQGYNRLNGIKSVFDNAENIKLNVVEFTTYNEASKIDEFAKIYLHFRPDCIMFYNDEYANSFLSQNNINPIFEEILITGFDNTDFSNGKPFYFLSPAHPKEQMGIDAANAIIKLLNGDKFESKIYPPDINLKK